MEINLVIFGNKYLHINYCQPTKRPSIADICLFRRVRFTPKYSFERDVNGTTDVVLPLDERRVSSLFFLKIVMATF